MMLYIQRDQNGAIIGVNNKPDGKDRERKSIMDEELLEFLEKSVGADPWVQLLSLSDVGIIRILEDLIELLIHKNIIMFTELPLEAQEKIKERKQVRQKMDSQNNIMLEAEDIL